MGLFTAADLIRSIAPCDFDFFFFFRKSQTLETKPAWLQGVAADRLAMGVFGVCKLLPEAQGSKGEGIGWHCQGSGSPHWLGRGRRRRAAGGEANTAG